MNKDKYSLHVGHKSVSHSWRTVDDKSGGEPRQHQHRGGSHTENWMLVVVNKIWRCTC